MIKKHWILVLAGILTLQSCSINTETTYFKDSASSMESKILMDQSIMGLMSITGNSEVTKNVPNLTELPTEWTNLYDIQKKGKIVLNEKNAEPLKKLFLKVNKDKGEILGLSLKYDKLKPGEIANLLSQSKELNKLPLQNVANWDGKSLTIDTDKFNSGAFLQEIGKNVDPQNDKTEQPKSKSDSIAAYGKQMASGMVGMLKMFNMNISNTIKFQKPIKSITGKHDFVKQIDDKTIEINLNTKDLFDENKSLINKDKKIVITTE